MTQLPDTTTEAGQREASRMLARLCGWQVTNDWQITIPDGYGLLNLYKPSEMALAWRVLNWAMGDREIQSIADFGLSNEIGPWLWIMPPADAQRAWLDKILTLAIEAGMIPAESDT